MSGNSRPWVLIGLIGLMVIGGVLIAMPLLTPNEYPHELTPIPTALNLEPSLPYPDVPRVAVADARAAHESKQAVFVDVRSPSQYAQSHIPGAKSIPLNELESRLNELNKDQRIITYCTWPAEESSARVAQIMLDSGFRNVLAIRGGFQAWVEAGYPTEP